MSILPAALALALSPLTFGAVQSTERDRAEAQRHYETGQSLMRAESFEEAVREFQAAIALEPLFVLAHYSLGQADMSLKRYPDAIVAYEACRAALLRYSSLDLNERAAAERRREDELRGIKDALRLMQQGKVKTSGGGMDASMLRLEERIRFLENSRMTGDKSNVAVPADLSLALGSAYFRSGKMQDAEREYRQAIQTDRRLGSAHNNLAVVYMLTGRLVEADDSVRAAEKAGFKVSPQLKDDIKKRRVAR